MKLDVRFSENNMSIDVALPDEPKSFDPNMGEFVVVHDGQNGQNGATFTPSVSDDGVISWTNDKKLPNPDPVNIKGERGEQGIQGPPGVQGPAGQNGMDGNSFSVLGLYESAEALTEAHPAGQAGEAFAVGSSLENTVYIWDRDKGVWRDIGPLQGPMGPQGPAGEQGIQGPPGPQGVQGIAGEKGDKGDKGDKGPQGPQGPTGATGPTGPQGEQGPQGIQGEIGPRGNKGEDGYTPQKGVDYFDGQDGKDGEPGAQGEPGYSPVKGIDYWTDVDKQEIISELSPPISAAGMLIYVDADGNYAYLSLGSGLSIVDGVLTLNGTITPDQPNDTTAVLGAATLGTMVLGNGG